MSTLCLPTRNVAVKPCKGPNLSIRTFSPGGRRGLDLAGAAAFDRGCQRFSATVVAAQRGRGLIAQTRPTDQVAPNREFYPLLSNSHE